MARNTPAETFAASSVSAALFANSVVVGGRTKNMLSEAQESHRPMAGEMSPAFLGLLERPDLSEVAKAIGQVSRLSDTRLQPQICGSGGAPSASTVVQSPGPIRAQSSHHPGWMNAMGIARVDLNVMVPVQGHVPQAFLIWWQRLRQDLTDQLSLMDRCGFEEMSRRDAGP